jgi:hypothetical protein
MPAAPTSQQLHASNISTNIGEALEARVKDPLWFLARQWQTGEFEAENGGRPVQMAITSRDYAFTSVTLGAERRPLDRADPLEAIVEAEAGGGSPAWNAEALEYGFQLQALGHSFSAAEYDGRALDWWHFDFAGTAPATAPAPQTQRIAPTQLYFRGAPHPRWWRMEEGDAYFDSPEDPEPNVLSLLLPEFFYTDVDNWYTAPMPVRAGTLREITDVTLVDSFGIATTVPPAAGTGADDAWALFALDGVEASPAKALDGRYLLVPNVAIDVLQNAELEEVRFIRDEDANLVWAWERLIVTADGATVMPPAEMVGAARDGDAGDGLPRFVLKSMTARNWIPYVPRQSARTPAAATRIHLRRGRTDEHATAATPQYQSTVVTESTRLFEEAVPPTGIRVRRLARYARGSDGKAHFWVGRQKEVGQRTARPGLRFDYLDD